MSLRRQLLALGAVTLLLPWAGLRLVQQMEASLRLVLEDSLIDGADNVVEDLEQNERTLGLLVSHDSGGTQAIYAHALTRPPVIDGYRSDWHFARSQRDDADERSLALGNSRVFVGADERSLFLFFDVEDDDIIYRSMPGSSPVGDRIVLLHDAGGAEPAALLLSTAAPTDSMIAERTRIGPFVPEGGDERRVQAAWQASPAGYTVEVRMPRDLLGQRLGFAVIDVDRGDGDDAYVVTRHAWNDDVAAVPLIREQSELGRILEDNRRAGDRFRIVDRDGWVIADTGPIETAATDIDVASTSLLERLFRLLIRWTDPSYQALENPPGRLGDPSLRAALSGEEATAWYRRDPDGGPVVVAAVPIVADGDGVGAVLLEQAGEYVLTPDSALMGLVLTTVLISAIAAVVLLAYASLLSFRVTRLARAAETALGPRGEIRAGLPGTRARDEIGDLSRSFQDLLGRLREYTEYLQSLKSKLTHEIRTPLAIVSTSIDNLEHETGIDSVKAYVTRLRQGTERLESILQAMTAATRVEQAIGSTANETFDLLEVVRPCMSAYRDVYSDREFAVALPPGPVMIDGSADLIAQMLDKLVDNAVEFAERGTPIDVRVIAGDSTVEIAVANQGPALPEAMRHQLFDSLVTVREGDSDKPHLGLGLYIVMLVAEFHRGRVSADNLPNGDGVVFRVELPRSDSGPA